MQITSFSIYRYKIPLTAPLKFPMRRLYRREGLLLRIAGDNGAVGWGEVAPLPGFSREHLQQATRQAFKLKRVMTGRTTPIGDGVPDETLAEITEEMDLVPSVHYGFELGMRALYAEAQEKVLTDVMQAPARSSVSINALLTGDRDEVVKQAEKMRAEGFKAIKLKVGQQDVPEDVARVKAVSEVLGPGTALRLDANRAWDMEEAEEFAEGVADVPFEFIEEPLYDPSGLPDLAQSTGLPLALDESLLDLTPETLAGHDYVKAVVLKPTLLGGLDYVCRMGRTAADLGVKPIISGAYEGGIGTIGLIALAACIGDEDVPVGVDTYRWLKQDVMRPRIKMNGGRVDVPSMLNTKRTLNGHMLREV